MHPSGGFGNLSTAVTVSRPPSASAAGPGWLAGWLAGRWCRSRSASGMVFPWLLLGAERGAVSCQIQQAKEGRTPWRSPTDVLETTEQPSIVLPCADRRISEVSSGGYRNCPCRVICRLPGISRSHHGTSLRCSVVERQIGHGHGSDRFWREVKLSLQDHCGSPRQGNRMGVGIAALVPFRVRHSPELRCVSHDLGPRSLSDHYMRV